MKNLPKTRSSDFCKLFGVLVLLIVSRDGSRPSRFDAAAASALMLKDRAAQREDGRAEAPAALRRAARPSAKGRMVWREAARAEGPAAREYGEDQEVTVAWQKRSCKRRGSRSPGQGMLLARRSNGWTQWATQVGRKDGKERFVVVENEIGGAPDLLRGRSGSTWGVRAQERNATS